MKSKRSGNGFLIYSKFVKYETTLLVLIYSLQLPQRKNNTSLKNSVLKKLHYRAQRNSFIVSFDFRELFM